MRSMPNETEYHSHWDCSQKYPQRHGARFPNALVRWGMIPRRFDHPKEALTLFFSILATMPMQMHFRDKMRLCLFPCVFFIHGASLSWLVA
jgi:hypothetical protein